MTSIVLSAGDFSLLEKISTANQLLDFTKGLVGEQVVLNGTKEQFEMLLDIISDELSVNGFSSTFEPTEYGRTLERLIDALSVVYE